MCSEISRCYHSLDCSSYYLMQKVSQFSSLFMRVFICISNPTNCLVFPHEISSLPHETDSTSFFKKLFMLQRFLERKALIKVSSCANTSPERITCFEEHENVFLITHLEREKRKILMICLKRELKKSFYGENCIM